MIQMKKLLLAAFLMSCFLTTGCGEENTVLKPTEEQAAEFQKKRDELMESGGGLGTREMK